jgi:hypothetical protein
LTPRKIEVLGAAAGVVDDEASLDVVEDVDEDVKLEAVLEVVLEVGVTDVDRTVIEYGVREELDEEASTELVVDIIKGK